MLKRLVGKIIIATLLLVLILCSFLYARDRRVIVVDDQNGYAISNAAVLLVANRYQFNPVDMISLWRREITRKTDQQGVFII